MFIIYYKVFEKRLNILGGSRMLFKTGNSTVDFVYVYLSWLIGKVWSLSSNEILLNFLSTEPQMSVSSDFLGSFFDYHK